MTEHGIAVIFALVMAVLWLVGAWRIVAKREESVLGWKANVAVLVVLGFQWGYFAIYLMQHPNDKALLGTLAVPLLFGVPALLAVGVSIAWRVLDLPSPKK